MAETEMTRKNVTMPQGLWDRIEAAMKREGMNKNFSEWLRGVSLQACRESEDRAAKGGA